MSGGEDPTELHEAVSADEDPLGRVQAALQAGCDVNARCGKLALTPLHLAAASGDTSAATVAAVLAALAALLAAGADVRAKDIHGREPLHAAVFNQNAEAAAAAVAALASAGADVRAKDIAGEEPLHHAARNLNAAAAAAALQELVSAGADVHA